MTAYPDARIIHETSIHPVRRISIVGILIDQITKVAVDRNMQLFDSIPIVETSSPHLRQNRAAQLPPNASWRLPFFITVSMVAASSFWSPLQVA